MISVLIIARNEEINIPECLESVAWSDDILVIDDFSTDATAPLSAGLGARVVQRRFDDFAAQRNFGIEHGNLRQPWVLHLDADERVSAELRDELLAAAERGEHSCFQLASKLMLKEVWLKRASLYPSYQVRFGRKDVLRFEQVGHGQRETSACRPVGTLQNPLLHYPFNKGLDEWFERHARYARDEAEHTLRGGSGGLDWAGLAAFGDPTRRRRVLKAVYYRLPFRPLLRLAYMLVVRRAFLDGMEGMRYCWRMAEYDALIGREMRALTRERGRSRPERDRPEHGKV